MSSSDAHEVPDQGFNQWFREKADEKKNTSAGQLPRLDFRNSKRNSLEDANAYFGRRNSDAAAVLKGVMDETSVIENVGSRIFVESSTTKKFMTDAIKYKNDILKGKDLSFQRLDRVLNATTVASRKDHDSEEDVEEERSRIFSARRPSSQTHQILKSAGLNYERGHPVFPKTAAKPTFRNESRVGEFIVQPSLKKIQPRIDRRGAASALDYVKRSEADVHEQKRKASRAWWDSSSLKALDLDHHCKEGLERGEISLVLPHLCNAKSSLTRKICSSPSLGIKSVSDASIIVDTAKGQQVITTSVVKINAEAKDILCQIEQIFAEQFAIDIKKYDIPVRLMGESSLLQIALEQKSRKNAHLLCTPVRAVTVRKEIKLPSFQGRLMHSTMQKVGLTEKTGFDHLEFDYKRKHGLRVDEFPTSCARSRKTVHRAVEEILILQNMPREHVGAELARELGRSFLYLEEFPAMDACTECGFAELCCYLWVRAEMRSLEQNQANAKEHLQALHDARIARDQELAVILIDVERARRERIQANDAESFARKQLMVAREAKVFGWPGAERKAEVARLAAEEAEKVFEEAKDSESQVTGGRLSVVKKDLASISTQVQALQRQVERDEQLMSAYNVYLLTMENNPHPILGAGLRSALAGYESVSGDMRLFIGALMSTGRFAAPRRKTAEELRAEVEEAERVRRAEQDAQDEERNRLSQQRITALRARLADAPKGAPGPPPALLVGGATHFAGETAQPTEGDVEAGVDGIIDDLQDRFHRSEPGNMDQAALAEYFSHKIRGEHSQPYCCELGEGHLKTVHSLRDMGDLEGALRFCDKADAAFAHAGSEGDKKMWSVTSLKNSIQREQSQLQTAISFQKKAEGAVQAGILFEGFRKFYREAMNLYKGCGIAASRNDRLPALERLYAEVMLQEEEFRNMSQALKASQSSFVDRELDGACQMISKAVSMIASTGPAGQELGARALQFQVEINASLLQTARHAEQTARNELDSLTPKAPGSTKYLVNDESLRKAESMVSEIKRMLILIAIASCEVEMSASEEKLLEAQEGQAAIHDLNTRYLLCEIQGAHEQRKAFEEICEDELYTWPANEFEMAKHLQRASKALQHLCNARSLLTEAGNRESKAKLDALKPVELDLALRTGAHDVSKFFIDNMESVGIEGCDRRMPFVCVAAALNNFEGLQMLFSKGADVNARDQYGNTPLHLAVIFHAQLTIKMICSCRTLNPNIKNNMGRTALMCGIARTRAEIMTPKHLLWHLIDSKPMMTFSSSEINDAHVSNSKLAVQYLLELPKIDLNAVSDYNGETALILACEQDDHNLCTILLNDPRIQPNITDFFGRNALISAICKGRSVQPLLQSQKVDPNAADPFTGRTPLYYAITRWNIEALCQIVSHESVQVTGEDSQGWNPLHALEFENDQHAQDVIINSKLSSEMCKVMDPRKLPICRWWVARAASVAYLNIGTLTWSSSDTFLHMLTALTEAKYWGVLSGFLTHTWVIAFAIMHLGIETVFRVVKSSLDSAYTYSGVSEISLADLEELQNILSICCEARKESRNICEHDDLRVFNEVLKRHGQMFTQRILSFAEEIALQHNKSAEICDEMEVFPFNLRRLMWLRQIKRFGFHSLLTRPHLISCALKETQCAVQNFICDHGLQKCVEALSKVDQYNTVNTPLSNKEVTERISTLLDVVSVKSMDLKFIFDSVWELCAVNQNLKKLCQIIRLTINAQGYTNSHVRVVRCFHHKQAIHTLVSVIFDPARIDNVPDTDVIRNILLSLQKQEDESSKGLRDMKVIFVEQATASIFLLLQTILPNHVLHKFQTRELLKTQLLEEILAPFSEAEDARIECMSRTFDSIIVEFLPNAKSKFILEKVKQLVHHLNLKGRNPWKYHITSHVISATFKKDIVPPGFPEDWTRAHIIILEMTIGIDDEIRYLKEYMLPTLQMWCSKQQCRLDWDFIGCTTDPRIIVSKLEELSVNNFEQSSVCPINIVFGVGAGLPNQMHEIDPEFIKRIELTYEWSKVENDLRRFPADVVMDAFLLHPGAQSFIFYRKNFTEDEVSSSNIPNLVQKIVQEMRGNIADIKKTESKLLNGAFNYVEYSANIISFDLTAERIEQKIVHLYANIDAHEKSLTNESNMWEKIATTTNEYLFQSRVSHLQHQIAGLKQDLVCLYQVSKLVLDEEQLNMLDSKGIFQINRNHATSEFERVTDTKPDSDIIAPEMKGSVSNALYQGLRFDVRWAMFQSALSISCAFRKIPQTPISRSVVDLHFQDREYQHILMREYTARGIWVDGEPRNLLIQNIKQAFEVSGDEHLPTILMLQGPNYSGRTTILSKLISDTIQKANEEEDEHIAIVYYFRANEPIASVLQYITKEIAFQVRGGADWSPGLHTSTEQGSYCLEELRAEILHALAKSYKLLLVADNIEWADQIILSKEILTCQKLTAHLKKGCVQVFFSTENSKVFKYNALQAGLIGENKEIMKVFVIKGLSKAEQIALWPHFLVRCGTTGLHDDEAVFDASKQDFESPLYLLLVGLVPSFSKALFKDPTVSIAKQIEALSGKVPQLWKHDILPRIAFSIGCSIDSVEQAINILLSHCTGLRNDDFIPMIAYVTKIPINVDEKMHSFKLISTVMQPILRPYTRRYPEGIIAVEHIHLHMSSTPSSELRRMFSIPSCSATDFIENQDIGKIEPSKYVFRLKKNISYILCHHQDLFVRCVIQPFTQLLENGHSFAIPKLDKRVLMYCRIKGMLLIDSESSDTILMDDDEKGRLKTQSLGFVLDIVKKWSKSLNIYLDVPRTIIADYDLDSVYATVFIRSEQIENIFEELNDPAVQKILRFMERFPAEQAQVEQDVLDTQYLPEARSVTQEMSETIGVLDFSPVLSDCKTHDFKAIDQDSAAMDQESASFIVQKQEHSEIWKSWLCARKKLDEERLVCLDNLKEVQRRLALIASHLWTTPCAFIGTIKKFLRTKISYYNQRLRSDLAGRANAANGLVLADNKSEWTSLTPKKIREIIEIQECELNSHISYFMGVFYQEHSLRLKQAAVNASEFLCKDLFFNAWTACEQGLEIAKSLDSQLRSKSTFSEKLGIQWNSSGEMAQLQVLREQILKAEPSCVSANSSLFFSPFLLDAEVGKSLFLYVAAKNKFGTKLNSGLDSYCFQLTITCHCRETRPFSMVYIGNGIYAAVISPVNAGKQTLNLKGLEGFSADYHHLRGSPSSVLVAANNPWITASVANFQDSLRNHAVDLDFSSAKILGVGKHLIICSVGPSQSLRFGFLRKSDLEVWTFSDFELLSTVQVTQNGFSLFNWKENGFLCVFYNSILSAESDHTELNGSCISCQVITIGTNPPKCSQVLWSKYCKVPLFLWSIGEDSKLDLNSDRGTAAEIFQKSTAVSEKKNMIQNNCSHQDTVLLSFNRFLVLSRKDFREGPDFSEIRDPLLLIKHSQKSSTWHVSGAILYYNDKILIFGSNFEGDILISGALVPKLPCGAKHCSCDDLLEDDSFSWSNQITQGDIPCSRSEPAIIIENSFVVMYGGVDAFGSKLDDLYIMNLNNTIWKCISKDQACFESEIEFKNSKFSVSEGLVVCYVVGSDIIKEFKFSVSYEEQKCAEVLKGLVHDIQLFCDHTRVDLRMKINYCSKKAVYQALNRIEIDQKVEHAVEISDVLHALNAPEDKELKAALVSARNSIIQTNNLAMDVKAKILVSHPPIENVMITYIESRLRVMNMEMGSYSVFAAGFDLASSTINAELNMLAQLEKDLELEDRIERFFGNDKIVPGTSHLLKALKKRLSLFQAIWDVIHSFETIGHRSLHESALIDPDSIQDMISTLLNFAAEDPRIQSSNLVTASIGFLKDGCNAIKTISNLKILKPGDTRMFVAEVYSETGFLLSPPTLNTLIRNSCHTGIRCYLNDEHPTSNSDSTMTLARRLEINSYRVSSEIQSFSHVHADADDRDKVPWYTVAKVVLHPDKADATKNKMRKGKKILTHLDVYIETQDIVKLNQYAFRAHLICGSCTKYHLYLSRTRHGVYGTNDNNICEKSISNVFCRVFTFLVHTTDSPFWFTLDGDLNYFLKLDSLSNMWETNCMIPLLYSIVNSSNRNNVTFNEMWTEIAMWASEMSMSDVSGSVIPLKTFLSSSIKDSDRNLKVSTPKDEIDKKGTSSKAWSVMGKDSLYRFVLPDGACRQTSTSE